MDQDDVLFGNPKWLENFKKMKQAAVDPLYKDCPKHWTALRFNLQLMMMKSRHGYSSAYITGSLLTKPSWQAPTVLLLFLT